MTIKCPKCDSEQIHGEKKGFGAGKAVIGGVTLGVAGLLAGFIGSGAVNATCLNCGHTWKAGTAPVDPSAMKVCPFCAEEIKAAAVICRYCGKDQPPPPPEPEPEPPAEIKDLPEEEKLEALKFIGHSLSFGRWEKDREHLLEKGTGEPSSRNIYEKILLGELVCSKPFELSEVPEKLRIPAMVYFEYLDDYGLEPGTLIDEEKTILEMSCGEKDDPDPISMRPLIGEWHGKGAYKFYEEVVGLIEAGVIIREPVELPPGNRYPHEKSMTWALVCMGLAAYYGDNSENGPVYEALEKAVSTRKGHNLLMPTIITKVVFKRINDGRIALPDGIPLSRVPENLREAAESYLSFLESSGRQPGAISGAISEAFETEGPYSDWRQAAVAEASKSKGMFGRMKSGTSEVIAAMGVLYDAAVGLVESGVVVRGDAM